MVLVFFIDFRRDSTAANIYNLKFKTLVTRLFVFIFYTIHLVFMWR